MHAHGCSHRLALRTRAYARAPSHALPRRCHVPNVRSSVRANMRNQPAKGEGSGVRRPQFSRNFYLSTYISRWLASNKASGSALHTEGTVAFSDTYPFGAVMEQVTDLNGR
eukprot:6202937-Pleurochrysis_carterae.AAC.1